MINIDPSVKVIICVKKSYIWNPATCSYKSGKSLASIFDSSVITCDEIIDAEETKTVTTNFNAKMQSVKQKALNFTCFFINYCCILDRC